MKKTRFLDIATYLLIFILIILAICGVFTIAMHFHIPSRLELSMNCAYITGDGNIIDTGSMSVKGRLNHYPLADDQVIIEELMLLDETVDVLPTDEAEISYREDMGCFYYFYDLQGEIVLARVVMDRDQTLLLIDYKDGYILGSVQEEPDYGSILASIGELFALKKP